MYNTFIRYGVERLPKSKLKGGMVRYYQGQLGGIQGIV